MTVRRLANHQYFPASTQLRVDAWEKILREPLPPTPDVRDSSSRVDINTMRWCCASGFISRSSFLE